MRDLTDDEQKVLNRLLDQLNRNKKRNLLRARYADSKKTLDQVGFSIPPHMAQFQAVLGWPDKACSVLSRRLRPRNFSMAEESELLVEVNQVFSGAQVQWAERMAIDAAVRHGASFVFTSAGDTNIGEPDVVVTVCSALKATALRNPRSQRIVAALEAVDGGYNLYLPGVTLLVASRGNRWGVLDSYDGTPGRVLCTAYVIGGKVDRPFGKSRITRPVMALTDMAVRVMLRQEVSAEFFSSPQRYMLGANEEMFTGPNGEPRTGWEHLLGGLLAVPDDEDKYENQRVAVGQFAQMSMQPHSDHLRSVAMMFSGETSIPSGYLGILHDNTTSAEAILANEAELVSIAEFEIDGLSVSRMELAQNVMAVKHSAEFNASMAAELQSLIPNWMNPGTPTRASTADAMSKQLAVLPWMEESDVALEQFGYDGPTLERLKVDRRRSQVKTLVDSLGERRDAASADEGVSAIAARRTESLDDELKAAQVLKAKGEALGMLFRAAVVPEDAAKKAGLEGVRFVPGAQSVALRDTALVE